MTEKKKNVSLTTRQGYRKLGREGVVFLTGS
jgi:hypothetical protein